MDDSRLPKAVFFGELRVGKRPQGRPRLRYKDALKRHFQFTNIASENWETMARDRSNWRQTIKAGAKVAHNNWARRENERRDGAHAVADSNSPKSVTCEDCGKVCPHAFGFRSHKTWKQQNSKTK